MTEFNRFVVQVIAGGYVKLEWIVDWQDNPEVDYVPDIADAHWFDNEDYAIEQALRLYPTHPMKVIPIKITVEESDHLDVLGEVASLRLQVQARYSYYQGVVDVIDSLSAQATEELSIFKWQEYKAGKLFLLKHKEFIQEPL